MPIPLWGAMAYGGKLIRLDDPSVGADMVYAGNDGETQFSDTFTDSNGVTLASHTPTGSPNAFTWHLGTSPFTGGAFEVQSNALQITDDANWGVTIFGAFGVASYAQADADYSAQIEVTFPGTTDRNWEAGLAVRTDAEGTLGYLLAVGRSAAGVGFVEFRLYNTDSSYLIPANSLFTVTPDVPHTLRWVVEGTDEDTVVTAYWDGVEMLTSNPVDDSWGIGNFHNTGQVAVWGKKSASGGTGQVVLDAFTDSTLPTPASENAYTATMVTSPFTAGPGTYSVLRRFGVNVETPAEVQVLVQAMRDKQLSGTVITRTVTPVEARDTDFPQMVSGTEFQEFITLQGWPTNVAPNTSLGVASALLVQRRSERGGNDIDGASPE